MCLSGQELAAQLAAVRGGDATGDTTALAEENAALRRGIAELEAKVRKYACPKGTFTRGVGACTRSDCLEAMKRVLGC